MLSGALGPLLCALGDLLCALGGPSGARGRLLGASRRPLGGPRRPKDNCSTILGRLWAIWDRFGQILGQVRTNFGRCFSWSLIFLKIVFFL